MKFIVTVAEFSKLTAIRPGLSNTALTSLTCQTLLPLHRLIERDKEKTKRTDYNGQSLGNIPAILFCLLSFAQRDDGEVEA